MLDNVKVGCHSRSSTSFFDNALRLPKVAPEEAQIVQRSHELIAFMDLVPFTKAKAQLSALVDRVEREHARLAVTRRGRTAAVLINRDDLESLEETVAILHDEELARSLRRSRKEAAAGKRTRLERPQ